MLGFAAFGTLVLFRRRLIALCRCIQATVRLFRSGTRSSELPHQLLYVHRRRLDFIRVMLRCPFALFGCDSNGVIWNGPSRDVEEGHGERAGWLLYFDSLLTRQLRRHIGRVPLLKLNPLFDPLPLAMPLATRYLRRIRCI